MSTVRIAVHVTPRAARDEIAGWRRDELAVRVTAAPDSGKANEAACRTVARELGVPKSAVSVERGHSSRHKRLLVDGVSPGEVDDAFGAPSR